MKKTILLNLVLLLVTAASAPAETRLVPNDYATIQAAIDSCADGDKVIIAPGTYTGDDNRDIDFLGKAIIVRSVDPNDPNIVAVTIIDCNGTPKEPHRAFYFHNGEDSNSILAGFTITNGYAYTGGGICCEVSRPTITNCIINSNTGYYGGGIYYGPDDFLELLPLEADGEQSLAETPVDFNLPGPTITNCIFSENHASFGGGIHCGTLPLIVLPPLPPSPPPPLPPSPGENGEQSIAETQTYPNLSRPTITNCVFNNNSYSGISIIDCNVTVIDSTFSRNSGGGMSISGSNSKLVNCTFIENHYTGLSISRSNTTLMNCDFRENWSKENGGGIKNISWSDTTLINCIISGNSSFLRGGGIYNQYSSLIVTDCTFFGNSSIIGGGICSTEDRSATITNCIFRDNSSFHGGGIYNRESSLIVANCSFQNNSSEDDGGGIYSAASSPIIANCTFTANTVLSSGGGGIYLYGSSFYPPLLPPPPPSPGGGVEQSYQEILSDYNFPGSVIFNCNFTGNSVRGVGGGLVIDGPNSNILNCVFSDNSAISGGGMYNTYRSNPILTNCHFKRNSAMFYGGGMLNNNVRDATLFNCRFSGNRATKDGGGMYNSGGDLKLLNCIFSGNSAKEGGGGMVNALCSVTLNNTTLSGNTADLYGGGMYNTGNDANLNNCILWNDTAARGSEIYLQLHIDAWGIKYPSAINVGYSDVDGGAADVYVDTDCTLNWGKGNIDAEPLFVLPGFWDTNGVWIDGDYHLMLGSPCIDAGDPNYVPGPNETDLDDRPRVIGQRIDMGAYEYSPPISAEIRIIPRTINLASKGNWITCYIWLPEEYNIADIDPNSVFLEGEIQGKSLYIDEQQQVATARFSREEVQAILEVGDVELTITGQLKDGTIFEGTDVIRVIDEGRGKN